MEQLLIDEHGVIRNLGALDYRIPTFNDVPIELITHGIENHDGPGPYGSKGISEGALLCTSGALGSAVSDAVGTFIRTLPLTPERVWTALQDLAATEETTPQHT
jgi:CO/xanthine dehydrogenase Mo-binding subunit